MDRDEALSHRVVILHGFENEEIGRIMRGIKGMYEKPDVIFAKTTNNSLQMKVEEVIMDLAEDHEYFKKNPPGSPGSGTDQASEGSPGETGSEG